MTQYEPIYVTLLVGKFFKILIKTNNRNAVIFDMNFNIKI
jgi:hypothetical protein